MIATIGPRMACKIASALRPMMAGTSKSSSLVLQLHVLIVNQLGLIFRVCKTKT